VAQLTAELFERHDRSGFEVIGISLGPDDRSVLRARIVAGVDRFHDVRATSDYDVARHLNEIGTDIAVDLTGYTLGSRPRILSFRPAPIQVNYLGYPGTMGAKLIDYIIADKIVAPFEHQRFYAEKIVHLPDTFMPTDSKQAISRPVPSRTDAGLPEGSFIFCSFNESYKITVPMFDIWMRLLRSVEGSALWLIHSNDTAMSNLRREAEARGVDSRRLVFAPKMKREDHVARIALADLFLNTHPVNAGATAIDALSAGLPIVSYVGETFVQRVTASLLHAVGLPELTTHSLEEYEALALKLARDPPVLARIKAKLARNRDTYPLFDSERFARNLEAAYTSMWENWQRGESPRSFSVEPAIGPAATGAGID
jgi:protein O-GlcNAc transferase